MSSSPDSNDPPKNQNPPPGISLKLLLTFLIISILVVAGLIGTFLYQESRSPLLGGNFTLVHDGQPWTLKDHSKDLNILYVGYVKCPDVCPMTLGFAGGAFKKLSPSQLKNVQLLFLSVDAAHDSSKDVTDYAAQFFPEFIGLTGTKQQIDTTVNLVGASYMVEDDPKSHLGYSIAHTDRLFFLNSKGEVIDSLTHPESSDEVLTKLKEHL